MPSLIPGRPSPPRRAPRGRPLGAAALVVALAAGGARPGEAAGIPPALREAVRGRPDLAALVDRAFQHALLRALVPLVGGMLDREIARAVASESIAVQRVLRQPEAVMARRRAAPHLHPADVAAPGDLLERAHAAGRAVPVASAP